MRSSRSHSPRPSASKPMPTDAPLDAATPIDALLDAVAAKRPTPGGGAVAAVAGALAAAAGEMALNYSVGAKGNDDATDDDLAAARDELQNARAVLLRLTAEDQSAYAALSAKRAELRRTAEAGGDAGGEAGGEAGEPAALRAEVDALAAACAAVPLAVAATATAVLGVAERTAATANRWLLSDLACGCELALASARAAAGFVRVNLPADPAARAALLAEVRTLVDRATASHAAALAEVERRSGR